MVNNNLRNGKSHTNLGCTRLFTVLKRVKVLVYCRCSCIDLFLGLGAEEIIMDLQVGENLTVRATEPQFTDKSSKTSEPAAGVVRGDGWTVCIHQSATYVVK